MRQLLTPLLAALIVTGSSGCCRLPSPDSGPPPLPAEPHRVTEQDKAMTAVAMLAYVGEALEGSDSEVGRELAPCLIKDLGMQPLLDGWQLAWGPVVYKFALGELDDNMMYALRQGDDPSHLAVGVRGTNGKAILDWLLEDFAVAKTEPWDYGDPPPDLDPRISRGTQLGLKILQKLKPATGVPGEGQTLAEWLAAETKNHDELQIDIAGHSLGGALAPTLTLWLADSQTHWDPTKKAKLAVWALAGPTAGNADFATYSDARIGPVTHRLHAPYDAVPRAWQLDDLRSIASLYGNLAPPDDAEKDALCGAIDISKGHHYTQIRADQPALPGALEPSKTTFIDQVKWQHHCGYVCGTGIRESFKPVSVDCKDFNPKSLCPSCP